MIYRYKNKKYKIEKCLIAKCNNEITNEIHIHNYVGRICKYHFDNENNIIYDIEMIDRSLGIKI